MCCMRVCVLRSHLRETKSLLSAHDPKLGVWPKLQKGGGLSLISTLDIHSHHVSRLLFQRETSLTFFRLWIPTENSLRLCGRMITTKTFDA